MTSLRLHQRFFNRYIEDFAFIINQVLCRYENSAGVFIYIFGMLGYCSLHFSFKKIAKSFMKRSNSGLQKPPKLSKF